MKHKQKKVRRLLRIVFYIISGMALGILIAFPLGKSITTREQVALNKQLDSVNKKLYHDLLHANGQLMEVANNPIYQYYLKNQNDGR